MIRVCRERGWKVLKTGLTTLGYTVRLSYNSTRVLWSDQTTVRPSQIHLRGPFRSGIIVSSWFIGTVDLLLRQRLLRWAVLYRADLFSLLIDLHVVPYSRTGHLPCSFIGSRLMSVSHSRLVADPPRKVWYTEKETGCRGHRKNSTVEN